MHAQNVSTVIEGLCEPSWSSNLNSNSQNQFSTLIPTELFNSNIWGIIYTGKCVPVCVFISVLLINVSAQLVEFRQIIKHPTAFTASNACWVF